MIEAAKSSGKELMFNFNNRARPESYAIMEKINAGEIGTINSAQAKWCRRTGIPGFGGWFTTKALSGGGPLIDLLHMLDCLPCTLWVTPNHLMLWLKLLMISSMIKTLKGLGACLTMMTESLTWKLRLMAL